LEVVNLWVSKCQKLKPVLEYLPRDAEASFVVKDFDYPYYPTPWHYHPEYELVLVTESTGKRFIGDEIKNFGPGDLAFIGPNLPHLYRNDSQYYTGSALRAKSIVVHFLESSLGKDFLTLPEAAKLRPLFDRSLQGLEITGQTNAEVTRKLYELLALDGLQRWLKLVEILDVIAGSDDYRIISTQPVMGRHEKDSQRLSMAVEWVMKSFHEDIRLEEIARAANMSVPSFSRYFKQRTRKTFSSFVTEVRLGQAARLLQEDQNSIAAICYACGFNNLSNFNRLFKKFYRMSPLQYKRQYLQKPL
jgi:AraC-like DNA-binding protein